jgi:hypothetical protein
MCHLSTIYNMNRTCKSHLTLIKLGNYFELLTFYPNREKKVKCDLQVKIKNTHKHLHKPSLTRKIYFGEKFACSRVHVK